MPAYTDAELLTEIASTKTAIQQARELLAMSESSGGASASATRQSLSDLQAHMEWLERQQQRNARASGRGIRVRGMVPL